MTPRSLASIYRNLTSRAMDIGHTAWRSNMVRRSAQMTFGVGIAQAIQFVATPFILGLYGAAAFGSFSLMFSAANIISVVTSLRLDGIIPIVLTRVGALRLATAAILLAFTTFLLGVLLVTMAPFPKIPAISLGPVARSDVFLVLLLALSQSCALILRALMIRFGAFKLAAQSQVARSAVFVTLAIALVRVAPIADLTISLALVVALLAGDAVAIAFCVRGLRPRELRLATSSAVSRIIPTLRSNSGLIKAAAFGNILNIVTQAIPLWTVGLAFGAQAAGWFSAAQRLVLAPTTFVIATAGAAFSQHLRDKIARRRAIRRDLILFILALLAVLGPFFLALGIAAASGLLARLGPEWSGVGTTLMAMIFVTLGTIPYVAAESLPALLRLNRLFVIYHAIRLAVGSLLAAASLAHFLSYDNWLLIYVGVETISYASFSLTCLFLSRPRPASGPSSRVL